MSRPRISIDSTSLHLAAVILITFFFYYGSLRNFFYGDDFVWLDRAKHLQGNWASIFTVENRYFTPLTYISFYLNYKLFGLNAYWYHFIDIMLHALNGILLYLFVCRLTRNRRTALITAILFITSFSLPITVFWPSARTDAIMFSFFMAAAITYFEKETKPYRYVSVALYALALCAKGTALIMPFVLLALPSEARSLRTRIKELLPYLAVNAIYVILLLLANSLSPGKVATSTSFCNYINGFAILIVPERFLAGSNPATLTIICAIFLLATVIFAFSLKESSITVGIALITFGLLPMIFTREYCLAGNESAILGQLSSPSNRVYLSYTGLALIYGVFLERMLRPGAGRSLRIIGTLLVTALLYVNYQEIRSRNDIWSTGSNNVRRELYLLDYLSRNTNILADNSTLLFYNFEGSTGFTTALLHTFFDFHDVEVHGFDSRTTDLFTTPYESQLNNRKFVSDPSRVKLILCCPCNSKNDQLIIEGNQLMQSALMRYRDVYSSGSGGNGDLAKAGLFDSMQQLREVMRKCLMAS